VGRPCNPTSAVRVSAPFGLNRSSPEEHMPYKSSTFENVGPPPAWNRSSGPRLPSLELRANEARYFKNKYGHVFAVSPAPS